MRRAPLRLRRLCERTSKLKQVLRNRSHKAPPHICPTFVQQSRPVPKGTPPGRLQAARALADSAVQRAPRLSDAHFQRGRVLSELRQFETAGEAYRTVLDLSPEYRGAGTTSETTRTASRTINRPSPSTGEHRSSIRRRTRRWRRGGHTCRRRRWTVPGWPTSGSLR